MRDDANEYPLNEIPVEVFQYGAGCGDVSGIEGCYHPLNQIS